MKSIIEMNGAGNETEVIKQKMERFLDGVTSFDEASISY